MDDKEKSAQQPVVFYGIANIGCNQTGATFQTVVQAPTQPASETKAKDVAAAESTGQSTVRSHAGRPKKAGKKIQESFIYQAHTEEDTNLRLQSFYLGLKQLGWIAEDTQQQRFLSIFSGKETTCRVTWTGGVNTLAELFRELVSRKQYVKLPEGVSIWVMVNARFWEKEGNREFGNERLRSTSVPTGDKDAIDLMVKVMDPDLPLQSLREIMQGQR